MDHCRVCLQDLRKLIVDSVQCESCCFVICYDCDFRASHFSFTSSDKVICKLCESIERMKKQCKDR